MTDTGTHIFSWKARTDDEAIHNGFPGPPTNGGGFTSIDDNFVPGQAGNAGNGDAEVYFDMFANPTTGTGTLNAAFDGNCVNPPGPAVLADVGTGEGGLGLPFPANRFDTTGPAQELWRNAMGGFDLTLGSGWVVAFGDPATPSANFAFRTAPIHLCNVQDLSIIPEPSTIVLLGIGALGGLIAMWKKRQK